MIISNYAPQCYPVVKRTLPANVIFMLARYAVYRCPDDVDLLHIVLENANLAMEEMSLVSSCPLEQLRACCLPATH